MNKLYIPECLRNLPAQKSKPAERKRKKAQRDLADMVLMECIQRIKAERRAKPKDWERGYNSAITSVELFAAEIRNRQWAGIEEAVVNKKITTEPASACTCGPGMGCTDCKSTVAANKQQEQPHDSE